LYNDETKLATDLIESLHLDISISSVVRLGKQSIKPKPVRIVLNSPQSVFAILKSKKTFVKHPTLEECVDYNGFNLLSKVQFISIKKIT
jgi:hypothetical protein